MITPPEYHAIRMSLRVAAEALVWSLPPGIGLGWVLARKKFFGKALLEILIFLPLVLPPVVTGYLVLVLFGRHGWLWGPIYRLWPLDIIFTPHGMALAAGLVGFPLLVRSVQASIASVDRRLEQAAHTLGCSPPRTFFLVTLPLAWPGIVAGMLLFFARALGEFGATRMVALNADGTRTIALEIFQLMETPGGDTDAIWRLAAVSILLSAAALAACELLARKWRPRDAGT